jgi:hypothetical protein
MMSLQDDGSFYAYLEGDSVPVSLHEGSDDGPEFGMKLADPRYGVEGNPAMREVRIVITDGSMTKGAVMTLSYESAMNLILALETQCKRIGHPPFGGAQAN